jgi:hypothetical protein
MSYQAMKRHEGTELSKKKKSQTQKKAIYCMIPTIWHSGKDMKTVKYWFPEVKWERGR